MEPFDYEELNAAEYIPRPQPLPCVPSARRIDNVLGVSIRPPKGHKTSARAPTKSGLKITSDQTLKQKFYIAVFSRPPLNTHSKNDSGRAMRTPRLSV